MSEPSSGALSVGFAAVPGDDGAPAARVHAGWQVEILPLGARFTAQPDETLLDAAQRAGVHLPRSCRNGSCRACLCHLREGQLAYRIDWPSLSPDDKDEGAMLPCVALAHSDLTVWAPHARWVDDTPK